MGQPKPETGLYQRGSRWWIRYTDANGKQRQESAKTTRKEEARALLAKKRALIHTNRFFPEAKDASLTMEGLHELWKTKAKKLKSYETNEYRWPIILGFFGPKTKVITLTPTDIERFKTSREEAGCKAATINRYRALLSKSLRIAAQNGYAHADPMSGVEKEDESDSERDREWSEEEFDAVFALVPPRIKLVLMFARETGMRRGEITELTWDHIDLEKRIITLKAGKTKNKHGRKVPISDALLDYLKTRIDWEPDKDGRIVGWANSYVSKLVTNTIRECGFNDLRLHDLRRNAASNLRRMGVDVMTIKAITGHRTLQMLSRYQGHSEEELVEAVSKSPVYSLTAEQADDRWGETPAEFSAKNEELWSKARGGDDHALFEVIRRDPKYLAKEHTIARIHEEREMLCRRLDDFTGQLIGEELRNLSTNEHVLRGANFLEELSKAVRSPGYKKGKRNARSRIRDAYRRNQKRLRAFEWLATEKGDITFIKWIAARYRDGVTFDDDGDMLFSDNPLNASEDQCEILAADPAIIDRWWESADETPSERASQMTEVELKISRNTIAKALAAPK